MPETDQKKAKITEDIKHVLGKLWGVEKIMFYIRSSLGKPEQGDQMASSH